MRYAKCASSAELPVAVAALLLSARQKKEIVVLVTGVFDVLHQEHKRFLEHAKKEGDVLLVGLESDRRVKILKGNSRPKNSEKTRVENLEKWHIADEVFALPDYFDTSDDYVTFINAVRPNVLAVSSHTPHLDRKQKIIDTFGGEVRIVHQHNPAVSTTQLLQNQQR